MSTNNLYCCLSGFRDDNFVKSESVTKHCTNTQACGMSGTERHEYDCKISNQWKQYYCPDLQTQIKCIIWECLGKLYFDYINII